MWYEALWLKLHAEPGKRIIICQPLVETENAAWAILRSAKHDDSPGMLLSGEKPALLSLNEALIKNESSWADADKQKLQDNIKQLAADLKVNILAEQNVKQTVAVHVFPDPKIQAEITKIATTHAQMIAAVAGKPSKKEITEFVTKLGGKFTNFRYAGSPGDLTFEFNGKIREKAWDVADKLNKKYGSEESNFFADAFQGMGDEAYISVSLPKAKANVTAAAKNPKAGYYPRFITEEAKEVWDAVNEKYRKTIMSVSELPTDPPGTNVVNKRWAVAIIIFRRSCIKAGVLPFKVPDSGGGGTKATIADDIRQKVHNGNVRADSEIHKIGTSLVKEGLATAVSAEMFYETAKANSRFYITTFRKIRLAKGVSAKDVIKDLIGEHKYNGSTAANPYAHKKLDSVTDILWELDPDIGEKSRFIFAYTTCWMSKDQAIILLDVPDEIQDNKLLKMLKIAGRNWVKGGKAMHLSLTQLVEGSMNTTANEYDDDDLPPKEEQAEVKKLANALRNKVKKYWNSSHNETKENSPIKTMWAGIALKAIMLGGRELDECPLTHIKALIKETNNGEAPLELDPDPDPRPQHFEYTLFVFWSLPGTKFGQDKSAEDAIEKIVEKHNGYVSGCGSGGGARNCSSHFTNQTDILKAEKEIKALKIRQFRTEIHSPNGNSDKTGLVRALFVSLSNYLMASSAKANAMNIKNTQKVVASLVAKGHKDLAARLALASMPHQSAIKNESATMPHQPGKATTGPSMPHQKPVAAPDDTTNYTNILKDDPDKVIKTFLGIK